MTLRKYGLVFASAGLTITGVLWFSRPNPAIKGEDLAELASAVVERQTIAYLTGTNAPDFASNNIPVWITLDGLMQKALNPARAMATNDYTSLPAIYWLAGNVNDGEALSGYDAQWIATNSYNIAGKGDYAGTYHTVTEYRLSGPSSNVIDYALSSATRSPGEWTFLPSVSPSNAPFGKAMYGSTNGWYNGELKNWWATIGNGTNIYAYWSERPIDSGAVNVMLSYGSGHEVTSSALHFDANNYSTPQTVTIRNTSTNAAACFEIEVVNYGSTFVGVGSAPNTNPRIRKDGNALSAYVAEGGRIDFVMTSESAIPTAWEIQFTYSGDVYGPSTINSTEYPYYSADFTVYCASGDCGTFATYCPQTGARQTVAIIGEGQNTNIVVSSSYVDNVDNGGTAEFDISLVSPPGVPYITQSRVISTNYLNGAANVLSNLTRSIYICGADALTFTSGVRILKGGGIFQDLGYTNKDSRVEEYWDSAIDDIETDATNSIVTWDGVLVDYSRSAMSHANLSDEESPLGWWVSAGNSITLDTTQLLGCYLPYPSNYALASQYVSNVSIYVVTMNRIETDNRNYGVYPNMEDTTILYEISGSYAGISDMLVAGFGIGIDPATDNLPSIPLESASIGNSANYSTLYDNAPPLASIRLLHGEANPTSQVSFTIGTIDPTIPDYALTYHTYHERALPGFDTHDEYDWKDAAINVKASFFVVVVDWNWKHMNLTTPYVPESFTAEWLTANTNSP